MKKKFVVSLRNKGLQPEVINRIAKSTLENQWERFLQSQAFVAVMRNGSKYSTKGLSTRTMRDTSVDDSFGDNAEYMGRQINRLGHINTGTGKPDSGGVTNNMIGRVQSILQGLNPSSPEMYFGNLIEKDVVKGENGINLIYSPGATARRRSDLAKLENNQSTRMVVNDYAVKRAQEKSDRLKGTDKYKTFRDPEFMQRSATAYVSSKNAYVKHQEDLNMKEVTYVGNDRGEIEDDVFQQLKDDGYTKAEIFKFIADARKKEKLVEKHEDILFYAKRDMQKIVQITIPKVVV